MKSSALLIVFCLSFIRLTGSPSQSFTHVIATPNGTVTLPCNGTFRSKSTAVVWESDGGVRVARYYQGKLEPGPGFENRVHLSKEGIESGNFSLTISPVEYMDGDFFSYRCMIKTGKETELRDFGDVRLEVLEPREVSALVGDPVSLPCYAAVDGQLHVRWEKDRQVVVEVQSGTFHHGPGFKDRVTLSNDRIRHGDLSLSFNTTRGSDQGTYRCFSGGKGQKNIIVLSVKAREDTLTVLEGDSITLPLRSTEPVRVQFSSAGDQSTGVSVCVVEGGLPRCETQYNHRVSIQNGSLHLQQASPSDRGVYRVMDRRTNDTISIFTVDVIEDWTLAGFIAGFFLGFFLRLVEDKMLILRPNLRLLLTMVLSLMPVVLFNQVQLEGQRLKVERGVLLGVIMGLVMGVVLLFCGKMAWRWVRSHVRGFRRPKDDARLSAPSACVCSSPPAEKLPEKRLPREVMGGPGDEEASRPLNGEAKA